MFARQLPRKFKNQDFQPARSHPLNDMRDAMTHDLAR